MRSYNINTEPVKVSVNGIVFELLKSDAVAQAEIMEYLTQTGAMRIMSPADVEIVLRAGCNLIDSILGGGACLKIFGETPVSLKALLSLLTQICKDSAAAYKTYLKNEYLEG